MTMTSQVAVARITREMKELEDAIDLVLARKNALVVSFTQARIDLKAPAHCGHVAMLRLASVEKHAISARGDAIRAHENFYHVGVERGDLPEEKPPSGSLDRFMAEPDLSQAA